MADQKDVCDQVIITLRRITREIDLHSKQLIRISSLTVPQILILKELDKHKELPVGDLAKKVNLSHATVTNIVNRLEKRGLITRVKSILDRRKVYVQNTEEGKKVLDKVPNLLQEKFVMEFEKLKDWEQFLILSSLKRIAEMLSVRATDDIPLLSSEDLIPPSNTEISM